MSELEPAASDDVSFGGVLLVTTENGSLYEIDLGRLRVVRHPNLHVWSSFPLRRDDDALPLLAIEPIIVGQPMRLALDLRGDGVPTFRQAGFVTSIERRE